MAQGFSLEAQVASLTERLTKAEEVISYLVQVVNHLQANKTEIYGTATSGPLIKRNPSNHRLSSDENVLVKNASTVGDSNGGMDDLWDFNGNMDLDWEELGLLDDEGASSSSKKASGIGEAEEIADYGATSPTE